MAELRFASRRLRKFDNVMRVKPPTLSHIVPHVPHGVLQGSDLGFGDGG